MNDFNIEIYSNNINDKRTKKYFKEVSSSYFNGNYRAAVVTLYSVVINDLILKLEHLEEIYSDIDAIEILNEIRTQQKRNPTNSSWESKLVDSTFEKTNLLDNIDKNRIDNLTKDRHLCAHPVIDNEDKLYTPNKETVLAHIINMLESVLQKPAILSKKIIDSILEELDSKKDILLIEEDGVEIFLTNKYLNFLNPILERKIFKALWKIVFRLTDEKSEDNRFVNYRAMNTIYKKNKIICRELILDETEYFNNITDNELIKRFLIRFLAENDYLKNNISPLNITLLSEYTNQNTDAKIVAWFFSATYNDHLNEVMRILRLNSENVIRYHIAVKRLLKIGEILGYTEHIQGFIIDMYDSSINYYQADRIFTNILFPNIKYLNLHKMQELCERINRNNQTYNRIKATEDHGILKQHIIEKFSNQIDFNNYPNIFR